LNRLRRGVDPRARDLVARFAGDAHFPDPVWAAARRPLRDAVQVDERRLAEELGKAMMGTA
jgi:hypothetical protein